MCGVLIVHKMGGSESFYNDADVVGEPSLWQEVEGICMTVFFLN